MMNLRNCETRTVNGDTYFDNWVRIRRIDSGHVGLIDGTVDRADIVGRRCDHVHFDCTIDIAGLDRPIDFHSFVDCHDYRDCRRIVAVAVAAAAF